LLLSIEFLLFYTHRSEMVRMYYLQKTSAWGEDWARTDIVLSSPDDDRILPLKFWSDHLELVKSVTISNILITYSMQANEYKDKFELTSTDQTVTEVIEIYYKKHQ